MADQGKLDNGLLNLVRAGWSTYTAARFPRELSGVVAGYVDLEGDEVGLSSVLVVAVFDDDEHVDKIVTGELISPEYAPVQPVPFLRIPFIVPVPTVINGPTTVRVQLFCRSKLTESLVFDRRTAGGPDYEIQFSVPSPPVDDNLGAPPNRPESGVPHSSPSWITRCIEKALDEWQAGDHESAMLFAVVAVDGTARRKFPGIGSKRRFTDLIRDNALVFERFGSPGLDVAAPRFEDGGGGIRPTAADHPDIADILYSIHRCSYAHGDDVPAGFVLIDEPACRIGLDRPGLSIELPKMAIIGLLAVCVLEPANADLRVRDGYELSWTPPGDNNPEPLRMPLNQWFGRRAEFLDYQAQFGRNRVTIQPGREWQVMVEEGVGSVTFTYPDPETSGSSSGEGDGIAP